MTPNIDARALRRQFRGKLWRSLRVVRPILVALLVAPVLVLLSYVIGPAHFSLHRRRQSCGATHPVMSPLEWMRRLSGRAPRQRLVLRTAWFSPLGGSFRAPVRATRGAAVGRGSAVDWLDTPRRARRTD